MRRTNIIRKRLGIFAALVVMSMLFLTGCGSGFLESVSYMMDLKQSPDDVTCVSSERYVHNTLSSEQQTVYDEMLDAIMHMEEEVRLSTTNKEDVKTCYNAICADYGEIFWVDSCSYNELTLFGKPCAVSFVVRYAYTPEEVTAYQNKMKPVVDEYLEQLAACETDYEKTELLYRKLIREVGYDMGAENNQNILSVFLGKQTVCQGYACATQYLLQQAGIPCVIVTGTAQGQPHAWNMVQLDGDYYYMDVTWGNTDFLGETGKAAGSINYGYLNITTEELSVNHQPNGDFPLAVCHSTENSYYVQKKLYFDSWDEATIGKKLTDAYENGKDNISVKLADAELLEKTKEYFIDEQHITGYCEGISQIYYVVDPELNILTIYF